MNMLTAVLNSTPTFVWGILAFCLYMGHRLSQDQQVSRKALRLGALIWTLFGLWGIKSAVGLHASTLMAWALGLGGVVLLLGRTRWPAGVRFDASTQRYFVPGSWIPMAMILAIFMTKYSVGVTLALQPELRMDANFALLLASLNGALGGLFVARARGILKADTQTHVRWAAA